MPGLFHLSIVVCEAFSTLPVFLTAQESPNIAADSIGEVGEPPFFIADFVFIPSLTWSSAVDYPSHYIFQRRSPSQSVDAFYDDHFGAVLD